MLITFDLSADDIRYFRSCLQTVKKGALSSDESVVLKAAADLMAQVAAAEAPEYVQERISKLACWSRCSRTALAPHRQRPRRACSMCSPTSSTRMT
jgi:hypothetical protein